MANKSFYVTTPIYYPNAKPHIGTLYSTLLADIYARIARFYGKEVFFLTGLDEHGQKMQEAAEKAGLTPQTFVDKMADPFKKVWQDYSLDYDFFIRTSSEKHKTAVYKIFQKLIAKDLIYKASYEGFYCVACENFLNKNVDGEDPSFCQIHNKPASIVKEDNYFFKLSLFQDKLLSFYANNPDFIQPSARFNEVISFVNSGLKDLSITRKNITWGIDFPGDSEHKIYVWGDALSNYITAIGYGSEELSDKEKFATFWPADLHIIGKDIVRFHAVYWPAILMGLDIEPPKKLLVHGYILVDNQKMSKSLGNVLDPVVMAEEYGVSAVRYYLAKKMAVTQDGVFDFEELVNNYNADLANNFGNLINRLISLSIKHGVTELDLNLANESLDDDLKDLSGAIEEFPEQFSLFIKDCQLHTALSFLTQLCSKANVLLHKKQPWTIAKQNMKEFEIIIGLCLKAGVLAAGFFEQIIPTSQNLLWKALGLPNNIKLSEIISLRKVSITMPEGQLFTKLEVKKDKPETPPSTSTEPENLAKPSDNITFDDFAKVKLGLGKILQVEPVLKSDKLYKLQVDFGVFGIKQVISGIAQYYQAADLLDKKVVFVLNLEPRKIMGEFSYGMILTAKNGQALTVLTLDRDLNIEPGTILS